MENEKPLVSVCIPAYNHEKYVAECIESVIKQDYKNIELIIINDGSKDNTHDVIMNYEDKCKERFVRFEYRNRENKGLSSTLNEIVEWSKGKYFTGVASDDVMLSNKVSLLVEELEKLNDSYAVAFGNAIFIDDESQKLYLDKNTGLPTSKEDGFNLFLDYYTSDRDFDYRDKTAFGSYKTLLAGNYLPAMSYVIKLDKIKEVGAWTSGNRLEDTEMWLKLARANKFFYVDVAVALYRWHDSNSMKTIHPELIFDLTKILKSEKDYANKFGNPNFDSSYYYSLLVRNLLSKNYSFKSKIDLVYINEIPQLCKFIIKKLLAKVLKS